MRTQNHITPHKPHSVLASSLVCLIIMMQIPGTIYAQMFYVSGTSVTISNNDGVNPTLFVGGNTTISSGSITNTNGVWQTTGNITNSGTITSTGTEKFSGSGNQTLSGNFSGTSYLGAVSKQNTGNIVLANDVDANSLTFVTDGTIDASSGKTLFINNSTYNSISGFTTSRYVDVGTTGSLKLKTSDITSGHYYAFPIGNSTAGYRRIDVNLFSLGATGTSTVSGTLKNGSPGSLSFSKYYSTGFSGTTGGPCTIGSNDQWVIFSCLQNNYWSFSGPSDYTYVIQAYTSGCGTKPNRVIQSPTSTGAWTANMENTAGTVTDDLCQYTDWSNGSSSIIPGGSYQGFTRDFAIAGGSTAALPVELLSLTANPVNNAFIRINWSTATEINNDKFILERSEDAITFQPIDELPGQGTVTTTTNYSYDDHKVIPGIPYYYRLRQVDYDGTVTLSHLVSAMIAPESSSIELYPNPNQGTFTLITPENSGSLVLKLVNTMGQRLYEERFAHELGTTKKVFSVQVPSGTYTVVIASEKTGMKTTQKITIVH